jgi:hypothetical protein
MSNRTPNYTMFTFFIPNKINIFEKNKILKTFIVVRLSNIVISNANSHQIFQIFQKVSKFPSDFEISLSILYWNFIFLKNLMGTCNKYE